MNELLRLERIKARYPFSKKDVLQEINLNIYEGDFIILIGPNGAGKSTLFKVIYGILPNFEGKIFFRGKEVKNSHPVFWLKKFIRYLPQGGQIFPDLSIKDNFYLAGKFLSDNRIKQGIEEIFSFLEEIPDGKRIIENFNKRAGLLSGGQRQIVSLGMVLLGEPQFLLLDEPTAGLAPKISEKILSFLKKKNNEKKLTLLVVEHNLKSTLEFSNRVFNMNYGSVIEMDKDDFSNIDLLREKIFKLSEASEVL